MATSYSSYYYATDTTNWIISDASNNPFVGIDIADHSSREWDDPNNF